ncbi:histidine kinase dimerization/phospho-acceptor domain-containing protein [Anthocerotibacter panamensis]|uniref:histidine kinase dimerization/phospho-acceptor domain-containing protein n=1 Tax=Anthocerotibacter panamensis TaxID=2857077 RepID=UPI001C40444C|nr:histidine kinase dimerization/phospho-acceptor domain-containing protein [Anthocerotibacter panamensis]
MGNQFFAGERGNLSLEALQHAVEVLETHNRQLMEAIEFQHGYYQDLLDFAPDGYLVTNTAGVILEANRAAVQLLRSPTVLVGDSLGKFMDPTAVLLQDQLQRLQRVGRLEWQVRLFPQGAVPFDSSLTVAIIQDQAGKVPVLRWRVRDITTEKLREAEYQRVVAQLAQTHPLQDPGHLLQTVAQHLRAPVTNLKLALHLLRTGLRPQPQARYLEVLEHEGKRQIQILDSLLELAQLESGARSPVLEFIDLSEWLPCLARPFAQRAQERNRSFVLDLAEGIVGLTTDFSALHRILVEFLGHCEPTREGALALQVTVHDALVFTVWGQDLSGQERSLSPLTSRLIEKLAQMLRAVVRIEGTAAGRICTLELGR